MPEIREGNLLRMQRRAPPLPVCFLCAHWSFAPYLLVAIGCQTWPVRGKMMPRIFPAPFKQLAARISDR